MRFLCCIFVFLSLYLDISYVADGKSCLECSVNRCIFLSLFLSYTSVVANDPIGSRLRLCLSEWPDSSWRVDCKLGYRSVLLDPNLASFRNNILHLTSSWPSLSPTHLLQTIINPVVMSNATMNFNMNESETIDTSDFNNLLSNVVASIRNCAYRSLLRVWFIISCVTHYR